MALTSIDDSLVTDALISFLETTADLSTDESGNTATIPVGDHRAPYDDPFLADIDITTGTMRPYLVVFQVAAGAAIGREPRSGYAGGTPSTRILRYRISAVALQRDAAQQLAVYAAARVCDVDGNRAYAPISIPGHEITRRERIGQGAPDVEGELFQWSELIELDVSLAP